MAGRIQTELKQRKPVPSLEEEAYLNLLRSAHALSEQVGALLRRHGLTRSQYNVLRILRGAGDQGLMAGEIVERMITRDPDVTRLIDRLEAQELVERWRCEEDRRVVWTRIAPPGLERLAALDGPMASLHRRQLGHLGEERLRALVALLEDARAAPEG